MEKTIAVAQYIAQKYKEMTGMQIDEMKLHKLLYFAQRESLAITGEPLFDGEFEGWVYGPVCKEIRGYDFSSSELCGIEGKLSAEAIYMINNIIHEYGAFESWKLSEMSHREISWMNSRKGLKAGDPGHKKLELDDIREDAKKVRPYDHVWDMYYDEFEDFEDQP